MAAGTGEIEEAHFLRRLSIADAQDLLQDKIKEKEKKVKEMHAIIGVRYQDLIESADKIIQMHSISLRLAESLHQLPLEWKKMQAALLKILLTPSDLEGGNEDCKQSDNNDEEEEGVWYLAQAPEKMWQYLDAADTFEAAKVFFKAEKLFHSEQVQAQQAQFSFLGRQWSCISLFRERIVSYAHRFLKCKRRKAVFYENLLAAIISLDPNMNMKSLLALFLETQNFDSSNKLNEALRLLLQTTTYVQEIWFGNRILSQAFVYRLELKQEMISLKASKELHKAVAEWVDSATFKIKSMASHSIKEHFSLETLLEFMEDTLVILQQYWTDQSDLRLDRAAETNGVFSFASPEDFFKSLFVELLTSQVQKIVRSSFKDTIKTITTTIISLESNSLGSQSAEVAFKFTTLLENTRDKLRCFSPLNFTQLLRKEACLALLQFTIHVENTVSNAQDPTSQNNALLFLLLGYNCCFLSDGLTLHDFYEERDDQNMITGNEKVPENYQAVFDSYARDKMLRKEDMVHAFKDLRIDTEDCWHNLGEIGHDGAIARDSFQLLVAMHSEKAYRIRTVATIFQQFGRRYCERWATTFINTHINGLVDRLQSELYGLSNEVEWIKTHDGWIEHTIHTEVDSESDQERSFDEKHTDDEKTNVFDEKVWLPWAETPHVSSFLFKCCSALDQAQRIVDLDRLSVHTDVMNNTLHAVFAEQVTITIAKVYEEAISKLEDARKHHSSLNFGESCVLQLLFDMYFIRASLGHSDFTRFGWCDDVKEDNCASELFQLRRLVARMQTFVDPVDWELLGPQLIENVVCRYRTCRMLLYSLSNGNNNSETEGKPIVTETQDLRPVVHIAEPVSRFSLLPKQYSCKSVLGTQQKRGNGTCQRHEGGASLSPVTSTLTSMLNTSQMAQIFYR
ncbi:unnamed protein product [Albugo candida]|uniref:Conserved oligomeric Golgi complex subunit 1 n=1 Tax=Albugo candida TaxID=65357 RepID=A0A024FZ68_9STRA|nr:unnamed protein product [Albugo candida]|eukprot:CCI39717.1 unnamed protein product [Albugo candida]